MTSNGLTLQPNKTLALYICPLVHKSVRYKLNLAFDNAKIKSTEAAKYLGVLIDNKLPFKSHILWLESKISRSVGILARLRYYLLVNTLCTLGLYFTLIHSYLLFGLPVWASTSKYHLAMLQRLQNKAVKIITNTSLKEKVSPCYYSLQILKVEYLKQFEVSKFMYRFSNNTLPARFQNYFKFSSDTIPTAHEIPPEMLYIYLVSHN